MIEVVWTRAAEADLQAAYDELEDGVEEAGTELLQLIDSALQLLKEFPEMAPVYERPLRRLLIRNGRHGLFYDVEPRGIIVQAFADLRRNPDDLRLRFRTIVSSEG